MNICQIGDEIPEAGCISLARVERGGRLHRFKSDEAIALFCEENQIERWSIDQFGAVWGELEDPFEGPYSVQIGWIK